MSDDAITQALRERVLRLERGLRTAEHEAEFAKRNLAGAEKALAAARDALANRLAELGLKE